MELRLPFETKLQSVVLFFGAVFLLSVLTGCARIYRAPAAEDLAARHQRIAVLPPDVLIQARRSDSRDWLDREAGAASAMFQREMVSWVLQRRQRGQFRVNVQDAATTNTRLERAGFFFGEPFTPAELADLLDVDAVLISDFGLSRPLTEGGAVALGVLFNVWGPTNTVDVNLELHDKRTETILWSYNNRISGSVGSSPARLVNVLMRRASRKMPYLDR